MVFLGGNNSEIQPMNKVCTIWSEWGRAGERSHLKERRGGGLSCSLILIIHMKMMETQFAFCNLSFSCAIDLGIAVLWPRNEENSAFLEYEFSKVLVPRWQASDRIIQATFTASFITFVCFTCAFAYSVVPFVSALHLRQRPETVPWTHLPPTQAGEVGTAHQHSHSLQLSLWPWGRDGDHRQELRSLLLCVLGGEVPTTGLLSVGLHSF